jgi:outer membrane receptor protein involved in Fe transport
MKLKILILCILTQFVSMQAQNSVPNKSFTNPGSITGKIIDKKTNEAIPYASVSVKDGKTILSGGITKENGTFTISNLILKSLTIEVQFMGYKKYESSFTLTPENRNLTLPNIAIEEEVTQLESVSIVKEHSTIEQKIDRKVITVGKDLITAGATAADIMNNIPSVSVDLQNNTVSLRGNENVRVFIDGKPSNLSAAQALQQIPSTSIKQIELITNPSAKYNPEGMSGIINIILNKNANMGFNGNINAGVNFGQTPKGNGSLDLNYRVNKFNFYSTYSINNGQNFNKGQIKTVDSDNINNNIADFRIINFNKNNFGKFGVDFYLNDKNTLSLYTIQSMPNGTGQFITDVNYSTGPSVDASQIFNSKNDNKNRTYNMAYKLKLDKPDKTLELELNYNSNDEPEDSQFYDGNYLLTATNQVSTKGDNIIANLDFTNPINETTKIELGLESRFDGTDNSFYINNLYNSDFDYRRNIQSAYGNYSKQIGKWSYQLGARFESYDVEANFRKVANLPGQFKDYIFTAYPSAFFTYAPSDKNSYNFSYSRRVDRPSLNQVNPIREWSSPTVDQEGNPNLRPQFTNSVETNFTRKLKIGTITSGVFFRYINDDITQIFYTSPYDSNKKLLTYTNFDKNTEYGIELSGNLDFKKWWSVNFGIDSYFKNVKGIIENTQNQLVNNQVDAILFNARMNHTFKLTKDFRLQWFTMYRGAEKGLQFSSKEMWKTDLGARVNVLKDKGTFSVRYNDIFNKMRARFYSENPDKVDGEFRWESQMVNVNFSYRFGSGKDKALQRKEREKNDAQGGGIF